MSQWYYNSRKWLQKQVYIRLSFRFFSIKVIWNIYIDYRPTSITDRDEGISDVEDATELKLLLELSEQVM